MSDFVELRQVITGIVRWLWLLFLSAIISAVTGYAVSQRQAPVYEATTTLMVGQSIQATDLSSGDITTSERLAGTYADIAQRQPVLQSTTETLSLNATWRELKKRVKVKPVQGTQLLEITVEASSPEEARVTADEIAHQLILVSPTGVQNQEQEENQRFVRQRLESLQAKIGAGQERIKELEAAMAGPLPAQQVQELQSEANTLESLITDWENTYTQLLIFIGSKESPNYLAVIEPAQANPHPVRPRVRLNTLVASVVGLFLALGLIFLLEYLDDTLKSADDLSQSLGLTSLGAVGQIKGSRYHDKLIASQDPFAPAAEAYRIIRSNIQFMSIDQPVKSIMVTSSSPGEGKSFTVANLGLVMAQAGLKTIIVDSDLRRPVQHQIFKVSNAGGLTDLMRSPELEINRHLKHTEIENLQVITCGTLPPNPAELLGSQRMGQLLAGLSEIADVVIYDSPPAVVVADTAVLSRRVDGVVLVVEAGQTRRDVARQAIMNLQQAGAHILGGVLNRASYKRGGYYYYHYYASKTHKPGGQPVQRQWEGWTNKSRLRPGYDLATFRHNLGYVFAALRWNWHRVEILISKGQGRNRIS
jgi:succinoglycan biosynthesis transport protein ExoP